MKLSDIGAASTMSRQCLRDHRIAQRRECRAVAASRHHDISLAVHRIRHRRGLSARGQPHLPQLPAGDFVAGNRRCGPTAVAGTLSGDTNGCIAIAYGAPWFSLKFPFLPLVGR